MTWTFDADESIPFPAGQISGSHTTSLGSRVPAEMGTSVRRTTRVSHPSRRVLEALEAEEAEATAHVARTTKRKPPHGSPTRRVLRKLVVNVDDDNGNDACDSNSDSDSDNGIATGPATEAMSDDYGALKAMADADNQVSPSTSLTFEWRPHLCHFSGCDLQIQEGSHGRSTPHVPT